MGPNQSADCFINSTTVLSLTWKKGYVGQESQYFASWEANLFALEEETGPEGSKRPVGAQFRPIRTSTVEKCLSLHAVDVGFAKLLLNMR